jgi:hypothetical protein
MNHLDDAQLLERFSQRMAAIEAEVPMPPAWRPPFTVQSPHRGYQTVSSEVRFVAAAVIVALFGGFLLVAMPTTRGPADLLPVGAPASPSPRPTFHGSIGFPPRGVIQEWGGWMVRESVWLGLPYEEFSGWSY